MALEVCGMCIRWNGQYSFWFNLSAGVRQGGLLSPVLFAVYMDPLILKLRKLTVGCKIADHFYGCLLYADDIMLLTHSVNIYVYFTTKVVQSQLQIKNIKCHATYAVSM